MKLLDSIMSVLTYFDTSVQAYITPDQEPFVRKELERVLEKHTDELNEELRKQVEQIIFLQADIDKLKQADEIVRRLAEESDCGDYLSKKVYELISDATDYVATNPKEGGEGETK